MTEVRRIALVTGASRGIGRAIALRLAADGVSVVVHYVRASDGADAVVREIAAAGGRAFAFAADLGDPEAVRGFFAKLDPLIAERFGRPGLDILVNNAAVSVERKPITAVAEAEIDRMLAVNLRAPFLLIRDAVPRLRNGGRIVNISSMATRAAIPGLTGYVLAKAGLEALARHLALELGPRGITVNAVLPGATATGMNAGAQDPELARLKAQGIALGRVGRPEDIAEVVAFLASEAGGWVTGQSIDASGGQRL